jgi:hypothetical protein
MFKDIMLQQNHHINLRTLQKLKMLELIIIIELAALTYYLINN